MVYLTRKEHFNAAHRLYKADWSDEKNEEVFGKCSNKNWHGHNYDLYVTVKGEPNEDTGFILNVKDLSRIIREQVVRHIDHKNLNIDVEFMQGIQPSVENLAIAIWKRLDGKIPAGRLHCIKLYETESIYVEYYGN